MKSEKISELTTARLSVYLRCLNMLHASGIKTISSQSLAQQFNLNSAQIRKDLGYFGEFGVRGV
ncbi:MAG: redox-sensing transcriptional repressor Rex, partial [Acidobacteria bacterium]